ncbi:MAG: GH3 auxin-responsive promoter family protein [Chloroflexota bacterium]
MRKESETVMVAERKGLLGDDARLSWERFCGFLNLPLSEFMGIQEQLLLEEVRLVGDSFLGRELLGGRKPSSVDRFRQSVPLTTYEDYCPHLKEKREDVLSEKPYYWAYTSGRSGDAKWIPYTRRAVERLVDSVMAGFILSCTDRKGEVRLDKGYRILHNMPSRPYLSGHAVFSMAERFDLRSVIPLDAWEQMDFHEKISEGFNKALLGGVDIIVSMSSVMAKMGASFGHHSGGFGLSRHLQHPGALLRLACGLLRARLAGRAMRPGDLWPVKAIVSWGMDSAIYRDKIKRYWGVTPYEFYACTDAGVIAMQSWRKQGLIPVPYSAFLEFIPEEEWLRSRRDSGYEPHTVLLNQVEPGQLYELVITTYHGMPLLRYRVGHLVRVVSLAEEDSKIEIPSLSFEGRADDILDVGGFIRLGEKAISHALDMTGVEYVDWTMCKEREDGKPILRFYVELRNGTDSDALSKALHKSLVSCDPCYRDLDRMLEMNPIRVATLAPGTFKRYAQDKQRNSLSIELLRPPRTNPPEGDIANLLKFSHN